MEEWIEQTLENIRKKMDWVSEKNKNKIPYTTGEDGNYDDKSAWDVTFAVDDGLAWWTNGFWGGMLWLLYMDTKDEKYAKIAQSSEYKMEQTFSDYYGLHHDVGFMFQPTAVADYRILRNQRSRRTALHAASLLAGRFNPTGNFIRAWNDLDGKDTRGWAIIDCMFNISLLYWATEETKDSRFRDIAIRHADTVMRNFVREDGSVCHIVEFDLETGHMVQSYGGQGFTKGSAWSRGQGWAIYGFMISYLHTGKEEYFKTAKRVADYCLAHMPENGIVPVDFCQPKEPAWEDSCGACVIAGGLIELSREMSECEGEAYLNMAKKILKNIALTRVDWSNDCDAMVQNCTAAYHDKRHHFTMNYADYYFMEAMYKLKELPFFMW